MWSGLSGRLMSVRLLTPASIAALPLVTADAPCFMLDRVFERQVLEGVQRVVVNEDADRPLRRQQVREPIHRRALGEWRRYARQLEPLRAAIGA